MLESKAAFARRKSWNRSTVTRYAQAGKIVLTKEGLVDVEASEQRLAMIADPDKEGVRQRHERDRRRAGKPPAETADQEQDDDALRVDPEDNAYQQLTKYRASESKERGETLRLQREKLEGKLGDVEAMRKRGMQLALGVQEGVMSLRYRLDPLLAGETDPVKRAEIWDRECRAICEELARGVTAPFEQDSGGD